jgi:hypothetical protein
VQAGAGGKVSRLSEGAFVDLTLTVSTLDRDLVATGDGFVPEVTEMISAVTGWDARLRSAWARTLPSLWRIS